MEILNGKLIFFLLQRLADVHWWGCDSVWFCLFLNLVEFAHDRGVVGGRCFSQLVISLTNESHPLRIQKSSQEGFQFTHAI